MPIVKQKIKPAPKATQEVAGEAYDAGDLETDVKALEAIGNLLTSLKDDISHLKAQAEGAQAEYDIIAGRVSEYVVAQNKVADDQAWETFVAGKKVYVGAKSLKRTIVDMAGVIKKLGMDVFLQLAKVNLTDLDKYMTEPERAEVIKSDRVGERKVKVT